MNSVETQQEEFLFPADQEPTSFWMPDDFNKLLAWAVDQNASDINLIPNDPIWVRVHGNWYAVSRRPITTPEISGLLDSMSRNSAASARVKGSQDLDFLYEVKRDRLTRNRFRCNATGCRDGWSSGINMVMRTIPAIPPELASLNLEQDILDAAFPENGLVLVTGVMGSGKSTLLASVFRHIRETQRRFCLTYEAPIEFDLMGIPTKIGPMVQSGIPEHLADFVAAPRNSTRRAANVILIGESRDAETLRGMIEVAEIGVAAYSTVHTRSVAETPSRIINVFPSSIQNQMAVSMLSSLRLIVHQRLVPDVNGERVALREYLAFTDDMREELMATKQDLVQALSAMVDGEGQSLLADARQKHAEGRLGQVELDKIEIEFERRQD